MKCCVSKPSCYFNMKETHSEFPGSQSTYIVVLFRLKIAFLLSSRC